MSDAAELFQAIIDDHRRRPRNRGPLPTANRVATRENPACGDVCTIRLRVENNQVAAAAFTGAGCALSQASASLATTALAGLSLSDARSLAAAVTRLVRTGAAPEAPPVGDLAALAAVAGFPARHACALLAWDATRAAINQPPPAG